MFSTRKTLERSSPAYSLLREAGAEEEAGAEAVAVEAEAEGEAVELGAEAAEAEAEAVELEAGAGAEVEPVEAAVAVVAAAEAAALEAAPGVAEVAAAPAVCHGEVASRRARSRHDAQIKKGPATTGPFPLRDRRAAVACRASQKNMGSNREYSRAPRH
jgi:hypothetical protein